MDTNSIVFSGLRYLIKPDGRPDGIISWYSTTNGGTRWDSIPDINHFNAGLALLAKDITNWMYITYQDVPDFPNVVKCYLSSDAGKSWRMTKSWYDILLSNMWKSNTRRIVLFNCKDRISASFHPGTFVSIDGGETWSTFPYYSVAKMGVLPQDTSLWVIDLGTPCGSLDGKTVDGYLFRVHPFTQWTEPRGKLMYPQKVRWIDNVNEKVFALSTDGRLFVFNDLMVSVQNESKHANDDFTRISIFPNPFGSATKYGNPITSISFTLPESQHVRLSVIDLLGREVAVLVNKEVTDGNHVVEFNGDGLPSGVYQLVLLAGEKVVTLKLNLVK